MALNIELLADAIIDYAADRFEAQLDAVTALTDTKIPLPPPRRENYFIGEPSRFKPYTVPAVFLMTDRTQFPGKASNTAPGQMEAMDHRLFADILVEARDEQTLTRMCWRYAEAFKSTIDEADVFTTVTSRSCKVFVTSVDYGVIIAREMQGRNVFRKDILVELFVKHYDQRTPIGASPTGTPQQAVTSTVPVSASDTQLTSTSPTTIVTYQPTGSGGNFLVHVYYRVTTAPTDVTLTLTYTDGGGAQSETQVSGSHTVGPYNIPGGIFVNATGSSPITLTATAGTANQVYVSASIEAF